VEEEHIVATVSTTRRINAPIEKVFAVVAHIGNFSKAVPHINDVEFLTDQHRGAGTKFKETRVIRGRETSTVLEVTEYTPNERVRMVSDTGGAVWDTVFRMRPVEGGTQLGMIMDAHPHTLLARITTPSFKGTIGNAVEADLDAIKTYCESE
jgi:uncharacterized membrane protein